MERNTALIKIFTSFILILPVLLLAPLSTHAQDEDSNVIVHVHNPEGIEIGMIPEIGQTGVVIYDGDNSIGCGAYDAKTLNKPISISSGTHNIKAKFNGITKEQAVSVDSGETKDVIFTFDRANYINEIKEKLPMNFSDTVSVSGWTDKIGRVWKETELCAVGGDFWVQFCSANVSITVQVIITRLEDSRFHMEHHILGGTSSVWNIHSPPNTEWSVGAYGFVVINQKNAIVLPSTCDIWFVQGWGIMPTLGGIYLHDKPSNYLNPPGEQGSSGPICSYTADVTHYDHYLFGLLPGDYTISGGFRQPAGTYSMDLTTDFNSAEDIELASSVSDVPYYFGLYVEAQMDKQVYSQDDEAKISCIVKEGFTGLPITPDTITAVVTKPDGSKETVLLSEIATGSYTGTIDKSSLPGEYQVTIAAKKAGYPDGGIELDFTVGILEILNGKDFSGGTEEVLSDTEKLATISGVSVEGIAADGAARLLFRLNVSEPREVTFSIEGGTGDFRYDGILRSIDGQEGREIRVNTAATSKGEKAFVIYQAPATFVRPGHAEDSRSAERMIGFKVVSDKSPAFEITKGKMIIKPPVILIHGIWGKGSDLTALQNFLKSNYSPYIFILDYEPTNDRHFSENVPRVPSRIREIRKDAYNRGIAVARFDVVGHSMGGLLARIWSNSGYGVYKNGTNFYQGDINRLITIDSPHYGSFFADAGIACWRNPHSPKTHLIFLGMEASNHSVTAGAVEDLMSTSRPIRHMNKVALTVPMYVIVGSYDGITLNTSGGKTRLEGIPGSYFNLHNILLWEGYDIRPYLLNGNSDVIVSMHSQRGGRSDWATFGFDHMVAPSNQDAAKYICDLLNSQ